jgi:NAD(P) transhydrogenase
VPNPITSIPYSVLTVGIPREIYPGERRVAITPQSAALLLKKGFGRVLVERGAGAGAQFTDQAYEHAGATLAARNTVWSDSDILLKVRAPSVGSSGGEADAMRKGGTLLSFIYPAQNPDTVNALAARAMTSFAMDKIPRISRAQVFDVLRFVGFLVQFRQRLIVITAQWQTLPDIRPF